MLDGLNDPELLAHPAGVLADRPGEIGAGRARAARARGPRPDFPPPLERREVIEQVDAAHAVVEPRARSAGSRSRAVGNALGPRIAAEHRDRACVVRAAAPARRGSPSSCRPRSARGSRTPHRPRPAGRNRRAPAARHSASRLRRARPANPACSAPYLEDPRRRDGGHAVGRIRTSAGGAKAAGRVEPSTSGWRRRSAAADRPRRGPRAPRLRAESRVRHREHLLISEESTP